MQTATQTTQDHEPFSFGETGSAKIERGGIYARREENSDWRFLSALTDAIRAEARRDAATFVDEFPGEDLDPAQTDWDATAWQMHKIGGGLREELGAVEEIAGRDLGWEVYQATLLTEIRRLSKAA